MAKLVQFGGFGVTNTINTQCDFIFTALDEEGRPWIKCGILDWERLSENGLAGDVVIEAGTYARSSSLDDLQSTSPGEGQFYKEECARLEKAMQLAECQYLGCGGRNSDTEIVAAMRKILNEALSKCLSRTMGV